MRIVSFFLGPGVKKGVIPPSSLERVGKLSFHPLGEGKSFKVKEEEGSFLSPLGA